ncbi:MULTISPECIES: murein biosynthesis integral membrane protein MurJ [unclassified Paracoccus (in: a-proteobacteria)]|uniref:murein biosynthesis integral membrane protein MurJ n=1 Tax=unclassified Paracoccus (in: a-proteobacteria) TaxID=2688777 RepID=UPI001602DFCB|nr:MULTISPECIES: murein biosynthesis integral membrane protein MurJ [unclassified Paracoccus (in: a-proteobacteria)]MBB1490354.1 murein biosynthesis integral membrane protein MurJ [Paracoccus sp. MC1854]MBB1497196.1 murein biosynthesis integral membrane protein MurJ [Paracoccus sp. MC1862]QQO44828.1 murein biosynthesis integral membrane protein MurJ [Paracoccus sp. MC1862]
MRGGLVRGFISVGLWTFMSRLTGFVRDILMAAWLGTGAQAEAFLVALSLPNMFRRFFAEGAFNTAFVPMFSKKLESGEDPRRFAADAFAGLGFVVAVFSALAMILMPGLVWLMAAGFAGDERFGLAVEYGRITFPYILLISLASMISGVLNAHGRFGVAAAAPVLLNLLFILAMLLGRWQGWDLGLTLSWATPLTGVAQLALVWWDASRTGWRFVPGRPRLTPDMRRLLSIALPAIFAGGVVQVNLLVGRQVGSFFEGAIGWLSYSDRLYQLPLGVVGAAVAVVLLPELSRRLRAGDETGGQSALSRATEFGMFLTLPAAFAIAVIAVPMVATLFERGAFDAHDTAMTARALVVYALGLPAFVLQKILQPLYFAREDTRTPFRYAVHSMIVNAVVAVGLMPLIGFVAAALGTTVAAWVMVGQLWWGTRGMGLSARLDQRLRARLPRIILSSALMAAGLWVVRGWLAQDGEGDIPDLAILVFGGAAGYFALSFLTGAISPAELRANVRRRR